MGDKEDSNRKRRFNDVNSGGSTSRYTSNYNVLLVFPKKFEFEQFIDTLLICDIGFEAKSLFNRTEFVEIHMPCGHLKHPLAEFPVYPPEISLDPTILYKKMFVTFIEESDIMFTFKCRIAIEDFRSQFQDTNISVCLCGTAGGSTIDELYKSYFVFGAMKFDRGDMFYSAETDRFICKPRPEKYCIAQATFQFECFHSAAAICSNHVYHGSSSELATLINAESHFEEKTRHPPEKYVVDMETFEFFKLMEFMKETSYLSIRIVSDVPIEVKELRQFHQRAMKLAGVNSQDTSNFLDPHYDQIRKTILRWGRKNILMFSLVDRVQQLASEMMKREMNSNYRLKHKTFNRASIDKNFYKSFVLHKLLGSGGTFTDVNFEYLKKLGETCIPKQEFQLNPVNYVIGNLGIITILALKAKDFLKVISTSPVTGYVKDKLNEFALKELEIWNSGVVPELAGVVSTIPGFNL